MKFGRRPAVHNRRTFRAGLVLARALDTLGPAPAVTTDWTQAVKVPWQMFGNDSLGDCVCADTGHTLMLRTANASSIVVPTDQDVIALYEAVGGYDPSNPSTDQGCDETAMCQYLETTGFLGHKSDATGMVDPANADHVRWSCQLFGHCRLGFDVPAYAMDQFDAGKPWDIDPSGDQTIVGGHDVPAVVIDGEFVHVVTWGKLQPMTPAFFAKYVSEAHCELFLDWVKAGGLAPSGFDLDHLAADLKQVAEAS